jgi:putative membrane protein
MNKDLILREKLAIQRTVLANQATYLSFLRSSLYFGIGGLSLENLLQIKNHIFVEVILFSFSFLLFVYGTINFAANRKKIEESKKNIGDFKIEYLNK